MQTQPHPTLQERVASAGEELANALTHGLGLVLSLIGAPVLVLAALRSGDPLLLTGSLVFAGALVMLYCTSTLYHSCSAHPRKQRFRLLDHIAIFLLIAGTYTPFAMGVLRGRWGWTLFAIIWTLAAIGIVFKLRFRFRYEKVSLALYVGMGWTLAFAIDPMMERMGTQGVVLLAVGGVLYTAGVCFFRQTRSWSHPVWHLFVLGGSACHYFAVLWHAVPATQ